jgi:acyl carrier protein
MTINLQSLLAEVCECQPGDVTREARINFTPGWNSLTHISLMMRLGDEGFPVPMTRIAELTSYGALSSFLAESGGRVVE